MSRKKGKAVQTFRWLVTPKGGKEVVVYAYDVGTAVLRAGVPENVMVNVVDAGYVDGDFRHHFGEHGGRLLQDGEGKAGIVSPFAGKG